MTWRGPRTITVDRWDSDPLYKKNRAIVKAQRRPCARCGKAIAYDQPYFLIVNGRRTINRRAFHCGHIIDRARGGTHDLANLQAEHAGCSVRSGAQLGQRRQKLLAVLPIAPAGLGCAICGRMLLTPGKKYCSKRCAYVAHKNDPPKAKTPRIVKPKRQPKRCVICDKPVPKGRRTLCSNACLIEHNARAARDRYRIKQGLPSAWDRPIKTASTTSRW